MRTNRGYKRAARVSKSIHRVLSQALAEGMEDPRLKGSIITGVDLSDDLKNARIYWYLTTGTDETRVAAAKQAFEKASHRLKRILTEQLALKKQPQLHFNYDDTIDRTRRIETLLAEADPPALDE